MKRFSMAEAAPSIKTACFNKLLAGIERFSSSGFWPVWEPLEYWV
jgi:hypothetical protein